MQQTPENIHDRLTLLRESLGHNQNEFASILGISTGSISQLEKGGSLPSYPVFAGLLENVPNLNFNWLLKGTGEIFSSQNTGEEEESFQKKYYEILEKYGKLLEERTL
jgi:transcriptional regulator with XRE-family HTH domain